MNEQSVRHYFLIVILYTARSERSTGGGVWAAGYNQKQQTSLELQPPTFERARSRREVDADIRELPGTAEL